MKKTIIGVLAGIIMLSSAAIAQATLSSNLLVNGSFTSGSITDDKTNGLLSSGVWYGSGDDWNRVSSSHSHNSYASLGDDKSQSLFQSVQMTPGYTAAAGPVSISLDYGSSNINHSTYVKLYGSNNQPTYSTLGTLLGTFTGFAEDKSAWQNISLSPTPGQGYDWYTLVIAGNTKNQSTSDSHHDSNHDSDSDHHSDAYFLIDNASLRVSSMAAPVIDSQVVPTPVPAAVWLLGSGLLGIGILRRK